MPNIMSLWWNSLENKRHLSFRPFSQEKASMGGNGKLHPCPFEGCGKVFSRPNRLKCHMRTHTGERPYKCNWPGCTSSYTRVAHLKRHMESSHRPQGETTDEEEERFMCPDEDCDKGFLSKCSLLKHMKTAHSVSEKLYKCSQCVKTFKKRSQFKEHVAEHTNTLPFSCTFEGCDKRFNCRSRLVRHEKTHEGFDCPRPNCNTHVATWSLLRKHLAMEHKNVFKCTVCDKEFSRKSWLKQHSKRHEESREVFHCPREGCPRSYFDAWSLTAHIRSYHDGVRHQCTHKGCGRTFVNKQKLQQHERMHDPNRPLPKKKKSSKKQGTEKSDSTKLLPVTVKFGFSSPSTKETNPSRNTDLEVNKIQASPPLDLQILLNQVQDKEDTVETELVQNDMPAVSADVGCSLSTSKDDIPLQNNDGGEMKVRPTFQTLLNQDQDKLQSHQQELAIQNALPNNSSVSENLVHSEMSDFPKIVRVEI